MTSNEDMTLSEKKFTLRLQKHQKVAKHRENHNLIDFFKKVKENLLFEFRKEFMFVSYYGSYSLCEPDVGCMDYKIIKNKEKFFLLIQCHEARNSPEYINKIEIIIKGVLPKKTQQINDFFDFFNENFMFVDNGECEYYGYVPSGYNLCTDENKLDEIF